MGVLSQRPAHTKFKVKQGDSKGKQRINIKKAQLLSALTQAPQNGLAEKIPCSYSSLKKCCVHCLIKTYLVSKNARYMKGKEKHSKKRESLHQNQT